MKKMRTYTRENQMGITRKAEKGITLVALVVTIVVLLILAGISIKGLSR